MTLRSERNKSIRVSGSGLLGTREIHLQRLLGVVKSQPDILRGVTISFILRRFVRSIREGPGVPQEVAAANYHASYQVEQLDAFISHSWHANAILKSMALLVILNGRAAHACGLLAALLAAVLTWFEWLPPWATNINTDFDNLLLPGGPNVMVSRFYCCSSYLLVYSIVLVGWQHVRPRMYCSDQYENVFLDKLCINQIDPELKAAGINAIGAYLIQSRQLLLVWDATYFTRVWCMFEVAVYLSLNQTGRVTVYPIVVGCAEFIASFVLGIGIVCIGVSHAAGFLVLLTSIQSYLNLPWYVLLFVVWYFVCWTICVLLAHVIRSFHRSTAALRFQLQTLSFERANCFAESDREFVREVIKGLYGDVDMFEEWAKSELSKLTTRAMGKNLSLPYGLVLRVLTPLFTELCLDWPLMYFVDAPASQYIHALFGFGLVMFVVFPLLCKYFEQISVARLATRSQKEELLSCVVLGSVYTVFAALLLTPIRFLIQEIIWIKVVVGIPGMFGVWYMFGRCDHSEIARSGLVRFARWVAAQCVVASDEVGVRWAEGRSPSFECPIGEEPAAPEPRHCIEDLPSAGLELNAGPEETISTEPNAFESSTYLSL